MDRYGDMKDTLRKLQIKLLIGSHSPSRVYENILCVAAKESGIKTLSFQHGGYGERFNHMLHVNDFDNPMNDYFFVWGMGVKDYADKYGLKRIKIVPVGSAGIDGLCRRNKSVVRKDNRKKTVLYLPTSMRIKPKDRMLPGEFADNSYFLLQRKVICEVTKNKNIELLVKLHPNDEGINPISDFIKEVKINNCRRVKADIASLLPRVDLVISDFMSTALVQLLAMKKKAMFYIDQSAMLLEPEARASLEKAMYCFDNLGDFLKAISEYAAFPEKFPIKNNEEFLSRYGTYLNDGKSAERAVESIEKILSGVL